MGVIMKKVLIFGLSFILATSCARGKKGNKNTPADNPTTELSPGGGKTSRKRQSAGQAKYA